MESVGLKDFVKSAITDIASAISEANAEGVDGLVVNPKSYWTTKGMEVKAHDDGRIVTTLEFNLSVQVSKRKGGGIGLDVRPLKAGIKGFTGESSANSLRFSIPVIFPGK
mgnify:CR=1 FL=1